MPGSSTRYIQWYRTRPGIFIRAKSTRASGSKNSCLWAENSPEDGKYVVVLRNNSSVEETMRRNRAFYRVPIVILLFAGSVFGQAQIPPRPSAYETAPDIAYDSVPKFLKLPPGLYLGEGIGVASNSKGNIFVFTRSGRTRLFEFDKNGNYLREIGEGLYAFEIDRKSTR